jgi:hypothetical protein
MAEGEDTAKTGIDELRLNILRSGKVGIPPEAGECLMYAACVCLENQGHNTGILMSLDGSFYGACAVSWDVVSEEWRRYWADLQEATEFGAYGIAILLVIQLTHLMVIERSAKGTGFDYWLGRQDDPGPLFQKRARLEVSGILKGKESDIRSRVREKIAQVNRSDGLLPALVIVVEFSEPRSRIADRWSA